MKKYDNAIKSIAVFLTIISVVGIVGLFILYFMNYINRTFLFSIIISTVIENILIWGLYNALARISILEEVLKEKEIVNESDLEEIEKPEEKQIASIIVRCPHCGTQLLYKGDDMKCPNCGYDYSEDKEKEEQGTEIERSDEDSNTIVGFCPECGYQLFEEDVVCPNCGHKMDNE